MAKSSFSLTCLEKAYISKKRQKKNNLVWKGSDSFAFRPRLLYYQGNTWRKNEALIRRELPKVGKWTSVLMCVVILPLDPTSLVMPNMERELWQRQSFKDAAAMERNHSCLLQAHALLVWGRASGINTTCHSCRKGVNSFALGTTADAQDSSSPLPSLIMRSRQWPPGEWVCQKVSLNIFFSQMPWIFWIE